MSRVKIVIAAHKKYEMPGDSMYLPLHVGAQGKVNKDGTPLDLGYVKDNTGDNISELNPYFCELTGLYWAWKHVDADYIGLAHYRRHFRGRKAGTSFQNVLKETELRPMFGRYKVFVPKKRHYYIETIYSHYEHTHYINQLDVTRDIIAERHPQELEAFDRVVKRRSGYMFNMMIMERSLMNEYCEWLFDILFELRKRMENDEEELSDFQKRFYGRISEIIFNVWLERQLETGRIKKAEIKTLTFIYMEKIQWRKKITAFLKAKFLHKRYEASF